MNKQELCIKIMQDDGYPQDFINTVTEFVEYARAQGCEDPESYYGLSCDAVIEPFQDRSKSNDR